MPRVTRAIMAILAAGACSEQPDGLLTDAPACEVPSEPYRLARLSACPRHLALDDTHLYWLDDDMAGNGRLMRFPKCGSADPPQQLLDIFAFDLAVDDEAVYVPGYQSILRLPAGGGAPETLAALPATPEQLWVFGEWVYATTEGICGPGDCTGPKPLIWRVPRHGGDASVVLSYDGGSIFDMVGDDDHLYFAGNLWGLPTVLDRVPSSGGARESLADDGSTPYGEHLDLAGSYVYFAAGGISRISKDRGTPTAIVEMQENVIDFAVDGTNVYWSSPGAIRGAPADGGPPVTLIDGSDPGPVAVDHGALYFATCQNGDDAAVWIAAK